MEYIHVLVFVALAQWSSVIGRPILTVFQWSSVIGRPTDSDADLIARYAARHPNRGGVEECQELKADNGNAVGDDINPLNAVIDPKYKWPDNTAYYSIETDGYTSEQISRIEYGIADLVKLTEVNGESCIKILPRTTETDYMDYISVQNYSGCSSYVGRIGGRQRLSLVDSCVARHGTIMHEFLHAFGFHHEQMRTDRDDWVIINWDNIEPGYEGNFVKLGEDVITLLGTPYDYGSVMHYGAYGFAIDPSVPTIITLDENAEIGQRITLSAVDIERVQIHYGCLDPADSVFFKHLSR